MGYSQALKLDFLLSSFSLPHYSSLSSSFSLPLFLSLFLLLSTPLFLSLFLLLSILLFLPPSFHPSRSLLSLPPFLYPSLPVSLPPLVSIKSTWFGKLTLAWAFTRTPTISLWPFSAAALSGVFPSYMCVEISNGLSLVHISIPLYCTIC